MIHYHKNKLNPADEPSHCPNYMDENKELDITIARLMPTLSNKLHLDRLESKELAIASLETDK